MALVIVICSLAAVFILPGVQAHQAWSWSTALLGLGRTGRTDCWPTPSFCQGLCCPKFKLKAHHPAYDVRQYDEMSYASIVVRAKSLNEAQNKGLTALCKYTNGENAGNHTIPMAGPVLTTYRLYSHSEENLSHTNYTVALYMGPSYAAFFPKPFDPRIEQKTLAGLIFISSGESLNGLEVGINVLKGQMEEMGLKGLRIDGEGVGVDLDTWFVANYRRQCAHPSSVQELWTIPEARVSMS